MNKNAFIVLGAAALFLGTTSTVHADECTASLPNDRWSYQKVATVQIFGDLYYNPGNPNNDNLFVDVLTVTQCQAINPGGQPNADHSYLLEAGTTARVLVCNQINGLTPGGAELGFSEADCS